MICSFTSCDYFSFKRKNDFEKIDPNIDVSSVDTPPSFGRCNSIIEKQEKTRCFYEEIHKELSASLQKQEIQVRKNINETVEVVLTIHADQKVTLKSIQASEALYEQIPEFQKMVEKAIADLPKMIPANKKGIPVTSEYRLPITIREESSLKFEK
jgi:hypothetical protein